MKSGATPAGARNLDCLSLVAITALSSLPYVAHLGFYSDDWTLLASFQEAGDGALNRLIAQDFPARPLQGIYLVSLFRLFGLDPTGYHLVNLAVIACSAAFLYLLLFRLGLERRLSFATTLLFVMLPQLSAVRAWFAAFQVPLSLLLMLVSLHAQLSFARSRKGIWLAVAVVAAMLSVAAYEIFAPLIVGFAFGVLFAGQDRQREIAQVRAWRRTVAALAVSAAVLALIAYKAAFSGRASQIGNLDRYLQGLHQLVRPDYDWRTDSGLNIFAAVRAYFLMPVRGWVTGAADLVSGRSGIVVTAIALVVAGLCWWRLAGSDRRDDEGQAKRLLFAGVAVLLLGNATFLIAPSILLTSTGISTRVQVAAAIGVAMILVAALAFASRAVPGSHRQPAFALLVTGVTVSAFARLAAIERYWAEAPSMQEKVLSAARIDLRKVPPGATIILHNVCPYHGPAIVFETYWDVGGAFSLALGRPVTGDAVSPRMRLASDGLHSSIYKEPSIYPYGPSLYMYDPRRHLLTPLPDLQAAVRYFEEREPVSCPPGYVGRGVEV